MKRGLALLMVLFQLGLAASSAAAQETRGNVATDSLQRAVAVTTGINADDYPCAKAGIYALYQHRADVQSLSFLHPKRIFMWIFDMMRFITVKIIHFFKAVFNPAAIQAGLGNAFSSIRAGGNPLAGTDRAIQNAFGDLSGHTKTALTDRVENIIRDTTNDDGSCKLGR